MADLLDSTHGYQLTNNHEEADVLMINTCSIWEKVQKKVFYQLNRWRMLKEARPDLSIDDGGCIVSQEGAYIRKQANYVDTFSGRRPCTAYRKWLIKSAVPVAR